MKSLMRKIAGTLAVVSVLALGVGTFSPVHAQSGCNLNVTQGGIGNGANCAQPTGAATQLFGDGSIFNTVTNILLFLIGAISVVMLIIGGIRYVISGGDQGAVTSAKNTILYAIIGIVVAFLAFAAVRFVTDQLGKSTYIGSHVAVIE